MLQGNAVYRYCEGRRTESIVVSEVDRRRIPLGRAGFVPLGPGSAACGGSCSGVGSKETFPGGFCRTLNS